VHCTGVALGSGGLSQALAGAELLRLAGGPGRGWYPRHRQHRPASIEHLDRLAPGHSPGHNTPSPWESRDSRKPLTLPPNLSPKFFHRSPREALRRVTSLLIRKGVMRCSVRWSCWTECCRSSTTWRAATEVKETGPGHGVQSLRVMCQAPLKTRVRHWVAISRRTTAI
jgi:hypothetical protein